MENPIFGNIGPGLLFMGVSTICFWVALGYVVVHMIGGWKMLWVRGDGWLHPRRQSRGARAGFWWWRRS
jgi:hypothetical protein